MAEAIGRVAAFKASVNGTALVYIRTLRSDVSDLIAKLWLNPPERYLKPNKADVDTRDRYVVPHAKLS